jgi:hypothetical protein
MTIGGGFQKQFADENLRLKMGLPFYKQHSYPESPFQKSDSLIGIEVEQCTGSALPLYFLYLDTSELPPHL